MRRSVRSGTVPWPRSHYRYVFLDATYCKARVNRRVVSQAVVIATDAHTGLKSAIASVLIGAAWQRCRVHFMRNVLAVVPKGNQKMVAAAIRTIFAQPDAEHVDEQFEVIAAMLGKQLPKVEQMLREAHHDLLAFTGFPAAHWKKIWSTTPWSG